MAIGSLKEIEAAVKGHLVHDSHELSVLGVEFDSRQIQSGDLFIPLIAERDGHDFVESAFEAGAVCSLWQKDKDMSLAPNEMPLILVDDTQQAMERLAEYYLHVTRPKVIAVTGSNGKTTTKDITAAICAQKYKTHKTQGNFNNHIGVPKTIFDMPNDTEVLVVEMGMDRAGEIDHLARLVQPDIAIVTMIGESHIEFLGSREKIADAKMEILHGLKLDGLFIYPADEELIVDRLPESVKSISFGLDEAADVYATDIKSEVFSTEFKVNIYPGEQFVLNIPGSYNVKNALAALIAGNELDISGEQIAAALHAVQLTKNRLEWLKGKSNIWVLNDAYNASPTSMKAAIDYFQSTELKGRRIAVLGDILELGDFSQAMHRSIGEKINEDKLDAVYLYGPQMIALNGYLMEHCPKLKVYYYPDSREELLNHLQAYIHSGDFILIKSSFGTGLRLLVDDLLTYQIENGLDND